VVDLCRDLTGGVRVASEELQGQLAGLRQALEADGYSLVVTDEADTLSLRIDAGADACVDCLVPREIMAPMVSTAVGGRYLPEQIEIAYPTDSSR
jgi:hypothetical protein